MKATHEQFDDVAVRNVLNAAGLSDDHPAYQRLIEDLREQCGQKKVCWQTRRGRPRCGTGATHDGHPAADR